jgi:hypothetical protein
MSKNYNSNSGLVFFKWSLYYVQWPSKIRTVWYSNGHFSDTFWVRFSDAKNKMAAKFGSHLVFYHLKTGQICPVFEGSKLAHIKNIFFMTLFFIKRSRLATIRKLDTFVRFLNGSKTGPFDNRTKNWIKKQTTVWFSDGDCIFNI